jgi:tryptophanyl-tRNA synthetase
MAAPTIFSGIQPTGRKHLGNYIGAIRQYVAGQERGDPAIFCIVDLHAITVAYEPEALRRNVYDSTAILLAAGLDPERCILFRQSDVQEHAELCWMLSAVTAHGDLNRMNQFKEKSDRQRELVSAGLFLYPVLQAADVLAYRANEVPVGSDQRQHIELMREIARRFNERFGQTLVVPELRVPEVGARVMDLQEPDRKMSTTVGADAGRIYVLDEPAAIRKKLGSAVTDSGREIVRSPEKPGVSNLIEISAAIGGVDPAEVESRYAGAGYGDLKKGVAEEVVAYLEPVRERYGELRGDEGALEEILGSGAEKARTIAARTVAEVRERMALGPAS